MRAARTLPSLRTQTLFAAVESAIGATRRNDFRVVEFSVQDDHVHAIVEADDGDALSRGMRSLSVRVVRRVNAALGRRSGKVWGDRYHRRDLGTPRQVRNALVYVLANHRKHFHRAIELPLVDPCSSAPWFRGWSRGREPPSREPDVTAGTSLGSSSLGSSSSGSTSTEPSPTVPAKTLLLSTLWKKHGLLGVDEAPRLPG